MPLILTPILYAIVPFVGHWKIQALYNEPTREPFFVNYDDVPIEYPTLAEAYRRVTQLNDWLDRRSAQDGSDFPF